MTKKKEEMPSFEHVDDVLSHLQRSLHVPKNQYNSFGKYPYRNAEDILNAVKKELPSGATLIIRDDMFEIGGRIYVKATATLKYGGNSTEGHAYAREEESKKGMDASQVTGSTSSYARKYALNGLLCIDDTKDSDATNTHGKDNAEKKKEATKNKEYEPTYTPDEVIENLQKAQSIDALEAAKKNMSGDINHYKTADADGYERILSVGKVVREKLKNEVQLDDEIPY